MAQRDDVASRAGQEVRDGFYEHVGVDPGWQGFTERERLAAEFAERFALSHPTWTTTCGLASTPPSPTTSWSSWALCVGSWIAFGRLNRVFDVDGGCRVPGAHDAAIGQG